LTYSSSEKEEQCFGSFKTETITRDCGLTKKTLANEKVQISGSNVKTDPSDSQLRPRGQKTRVT
jgi:hypothetical protein